MAIEQNLRQEGSSSDEESSEEGFDYSGYSLLNQEPIIEPNTETPISPLPDFDIDKELYRSLNFEEFVPKQKIDFETIPQPDELPDVPTSNNIEITKEKENEIKIVMESIQFPSDKIPSWSQNISDSQWKELVEKNIIGK